MFLARLGTKCIIAKWTTGSWTLAAAQWTSVPCRLALDQGRAGHPCWDILVVASVLRPDIRTPVKCSVWLWTRATATGPGLNGPITSTYQCQLWTTATSRRKPLTPSPRCSTLELRDATRNSIPGRVMATHCSAVHYSTPRHAYTTRADC